MFWIVALVIYLAVSRRRRRWRRWARTQGGWYAAHPNAWAHGGPPWCAPTPDARPRAEELDAERGYVDALETRVAQLEERLDFTERLLAAREAPPIQR
jgi:hypothetical protein